MTKIKRVVEKQARDTPSCQMGKRSSRPLQLAWIEIGAIKLRRPPRTPIDKGNFGPTRKGWPRWLYRPRANAGARNGVSSHKSAQNSGRGRGEGEHVSARGTENLGPHCVRRPRR